MTHKTNPGDELALYLLCKLFNRHAVIITKTGLCSTLRNITNDGELAVHAKCDICLVLIGKGNTGFREVIHVTPTEAWYKRKGKQHTADISVQQAVIQDAQNKESVTPNCHAKRKRVTASINKLNILTENGRTHNTRISNGTHTRHTRHQLRCTYRDVNYKDMEVKAEDDTSPLCKREPSIAARIRVPSFLCRFSQGIITRNRLQRMAAPNTKSTLIGTAIKIEPIVKNEEDVKKEPVVNTRRKDRSWPVSAKLVHLDRTQCYEDYFEQPLWKISQTTLLSRQLTKNNDYTPVHTSPITEGMTEANKRGRQQYPGTCYS